MRLRVNWANGDVILNLMVSRGNWSKIERGGLKGKGYHYEGKFFQDEWCFSGGLDGHLRVYKLAEQIERLERQQTG
jgi:hypothetical protein